MYRDELREIVKQRRDEWRDIRSRRLELRDSLLAQGMSRQAIRRDRGYKDLKKQQRHLSRIIMRDEKSGLRMALMTERTKVRVDQNELIPHPSGDCP